MRIALVNDSAAARCTLRQVVSASPGDELAWEAHDGVEAITRCAHDRPDLILMDLLMPALDGVETIRRIMAHSPCPILVVTASVNRLVGRVFEAMGAGALDAVDTPCEHSGNQPLLRKIATVKKLVAPTPALPSAAPAPGIRTGQRLIIIGASTGGPAALATLLGALPSDFSAPLVVVQHVDRQFVAELCTWLGQHCPLPVRLAIEGARPQVGQVWVAGGDRHLVLHPDRTLGYTDVPIEAIYRPSVDVFFASVARHWGAPVTALLLTGMGRDGAQGLLQLRQVGAHTIAQNEASCAVYGMPRAAIALSAACEVLAPAAMATFLVNQNHPPRHAYPRLNGSDPAPSSPPAGEGRERAVGGNHPSRILCHPEQEG